MLVCAGGAAATDRADGARDTVLRATVDGALTDDIREMSDLLSFSLSSEKEGLYTASIELPSKSITALL